MYSEMQAMDRVLKRAQTQRQTRVQQSFKQTLKQLGVLAAKGFSDPTQSENMGQKLAQIIRANPKYAEAHACFAYFMALFQIYDKALLHANMAHALEPSLEDYQELIDWIHLCSESSEQVKSSSSDLWVAETDANMDYDQLEALVLELMRQITEHAPLVPTVEMSAFQALEQYQQRLKTQLQALEVRLETLATQCEVQGIFQRLEPISRGLRQIENLLAISQKFMSLKTDIENEERHVQQLIDKIEALQEGLLSSLTSQLEHILDHCDLIADHLDALEAKGYSISPLEPDYNRLVRLVSLLQDHLEEI